MTAVSAFDVCGVILSHFANASVAVIRHRLTASSFASWSDCNPPSNFVNGQEPGFGLLFPTFTVALTKTNLITWPTSELFHA